MICALARRRTKLTSQTSTAAAFSTARRPITTSGAPCRSAHLLNFSDWVSQDQGFIACAWPSDATLLTLAVSIGYRVGVLGFFASEEQAKEGPSNAGLLDFRAGIEWVRANADAFGGDASRITIQGQSGGAFGVGLQLALYNGTVRAPSPGCL